MGTLTFPTGGFEQDVADIETPKTCLVCGSDDVTRDHVVSRLALRMSLSQEDYKKFCETARSANIQSLCKKHNNIKGNMSCDLRKDFRSDMLKKYLVEFGLDPKEILQDPKEVFG